MTRSVYVIGGAGAGKSTFMAELLARLGCQMGPLVWLAEKPNKKNLVVLRGHDLIGPPGTGVYLGCMREEFPGTDGLDRASSPVGKFWLEEGDLPDFILSEGATLATRPFMEALHERTDLLLVHLYVDPVVSDIRFWARGSAQDASFVENTRTRSANLAEHMYQRGCKKTIDVDTDDPQAWSAALDWAEQHMYPKG